MKELSIEEKAKAYDEDVRKAKEALDSLGDDYICSHLTKDDVREMYANFFPELKESEDERILEIIKSTLKSYNRGIICGSLNAKDYADCLAWLEKHEQKPNPCENCGIATNNCQNFPCAIRDGEQKPAWSEEDEYCTHQLIVFCENCMLPDSGAIRCANWLKSLKCKVQPKQEWSEEDWNYIADLISYFAGSSLQHDTPDVISWLKSLKDRYTWRPSDEQMYWLKWAVGRMPDTEKANEAEAVLEELLEQLKKLMEE